MPDGRVAAHAGTERPDRVEDPGLEAVAEPVSPGAPRSAVGRNGVAGRCIHGAGTRRAEADPAAPRTERGREHDRRPQRNASLAASRSGGNGASNDRRTPVTG